MTLRRLTPFLVFSALLAAAVVFARPPARSAQAFAGKPEVVAATFASAWCSSCKILQPTLAKVMPLFAGEPIAFVEFDFTFGGRPELKKEAERYGLAGLYERNKGATGFTVLVDHDTGDILDTLTMNFSGSDMRAAIERAIAVASYTEEEAAPAAAN